MGICLWAPLCPQQWRFEPRCPLPYPHVACTGLQGALARQGGGRAEQLILGCDMTIAKRHDGSPARSPCRPYSFCPSSSQHQDSHQHAEQQPAWGGGARD